MTNNMACKATLSTRATTATIVPGASRHVMRCTRA